MYLNEIIPFSSQVVGTFNWPISEEQAWAVIHQTVRTLGTLLELPGSGIETQGLALVTHSSHLLINLDGSVANETFLARNGPGTARDPLTSEDKVELSHKKIFSQSTSSSLSPLRDALPHIQQQACSGLDK